MQEKIPPWPLSNLAWVHEGHICKIYPQSDLRVGRMPHNPPQMRGDEKPCGELPGSSFSSTTQSGGTVPQDHFPPSSLISIDRRTFYLMPRTLQGTDASYCVYKITWWNLEIAPLGQSDPLLVPPIFWPLQFSVILCEELGRQGAEVMWIFLSLSK